jgi:hypothetical protein
MEVAQKANPPSFETVWAILQEVGEKQKESAKRQEETDRQMKETDRIMKENAADFNKRIGALTNLFGEVAEYMVAPKLREKFMEFGLNFPKANTNTSVNDKVNNIFLEIDVMLENGDKAILVEVKTKLTIERINSHISRLEKMRKYANLHGDKRTFLGAVAGVVVTDEVRNYALNQGFYLIEPSGENFNITPPNGQPKEW